MDTSYSLECKLLNIAWAQFTNFWSLAKATQSISFLLTYVPKIPLSQITWISAKSLAAYFPLS
jgi:hypothetical protein